MSNLLSPEAQAVVKAEYWARVVSVWWSLGAVTFLSLTLFLLPTYLLVSSRAETIESEYAQIQETTSLEALKTAQQELASANLYATALTTTTKLPALSRVVAELEREVPPSIALRGIHVNQAEGKVVVQAQGTATTRAELASFVETLKRNPYFADASVPVSDLVKAVDATFVVTATVAPLE